MISWIIGFLYGSKTLAAVVQLVTIVARGIDMGFKNQNDKMTDFVWERLDVSFKEPEGSLSKDELGDIVKHTVGLIDAVWRAFNKKG